VSTIFWDVDTQVDFMHADGKLYVPGAEGIIPALQRLTQHAHRHGIPIVASADDHVPEDAELSDTPDWTTTYPPHCMRGTPGQRKIRETVQTDPLVLEPEPVADLAEQVRAHRGDYLLHKHVFDVFSNPNAAPLLALLAPTRIVLYGVATDVCSKAAVEGIRRHWPQAELLLVTDAMRAIRPEQGDALLREWAAAGAQLVTTDDVVGG
jgi:nicotinamidase/pyrazinamidase